MVKVLRFWCHEASNIRCVREFDYDTALIAIEQSDSANARLAEKLTAAQSELAALREELAEVKSQSAEYGRAFNAQCRKTDSLNQRLTAAEQRNAELEKQIGSLDEITVNSCTFDGYNLDGTSPFEFTDGPIKTIKKFRMIGWSCRGPKPTESGASE